MKQHNRGVKHYYEQHGNYDAADGHVWMNNNAGDNDGIDSIYHNTNDMHNMGDNTTNLANNPNTMAIPNNTILVTRTNYRLQDDIHKQVL